MIRMLIALGFIALIIPAAMHLGNGMRDLQAERAHQVDRVISMR